LLVRLLVSGVQQVITEITEASPDQAALVHSIMRAAFAEYLGQLNPASPCHTESLEQVEAAMHDGGAILAWVDGVPVGSARYAFYSGSFYVGRVSVLPEYRGCGVARAMMQFLEAVARHAGCPQMELCSRLNLPRNIALYERLGYHITDTWQVAPDADVQVKMVKPLAMPVLATA
jgi:GNAT superfamily N-acetyltransferase